MEDIGITPTGYNFLTTSPTNAPDFILNGNRFDMKASCPGNTSFNINQDEHSKTDARPDFYVLCLFDTEDTF